MYESSGILKYGPGQRLVVELEPDFGRYYLSLIPKAYRATGQRYNSHITAIRGSKEVIPDKTHWLKYKGELITFYYDSTFYFAHPYFFLECDSPRIGEIRLELGMPEFRFEDTPNYHITIGNIKEK